jgi:hypothetical protein
LDLHEVRFFLLDSAFAVLLDCPAIKGLIRFDGSGQDPFVGLSTRISVDQLFEDSVAAM